jgi:hypothetical protein
MVLNGFEKGEILTAGERIKTVVED